MSSKSAELRARLGAVSLRFRLTALFSLVTCAAIAALGLFLYFSLSAHLDLREREQLLGKLAQFRHVLSEIPDRSWAVNQSGRFAELLVGYRSIEADLMDESGRAVVAISAFSWPRELVQRAIATANGTDVLATHDGRHHFLLAYAPVGRGGERLLVGLAHDRYETLLLLSRFRTSVFVAILLGSVLAGVLGYVAAARGLAPLRKMVETAGRIRAERLGERLDAQDVPRDLRELASSFNKMLSRLEESFQRLSRFSADLAHELRTPLGNVMLHAQVALERPRTEPELREVLVSSLEELQRLSKMVNEMLFLARADNAQILLDQEPFLLEEEVEKVLEFFEPLASERGIRLERHGSGRVRGDRSMMRRLIANLVSNAVRHADARSTVEARITAQSGRVDICILNDGPPLSQEERERAFDRFYRGPRSSAAPSDGAGLGLAIVKSIVELHGGTVAAESRSGRNAFSASLAAG